MARAAPARRIAQARLLTGDHAGALDASEYAASITTDGVEASVAKALSGMVHWARGDLKDAQILITAAVDALSLAGALRDEALYRLHLGDLQRTMGEPEPASEHYHRALALYEALQDEPHLAMCSHRLGTLNLDLDKLRDARGHLANALARFTSYFRTGV